MRAQVGVIGGSGLYQLQGLKQAKAVRVKTPFGKPSGPIVLGSLDGVSCAFVPRHGPGHVLLPGEINVRANIWALKSLGVDRVIAVAAVGSLKEELAPKHFVFPDQFVDRTKGRTSTFFGGGIVAHTAFDQPVCSAQTDILHGAAKGADILAHRGGVYVCMEGPLFSTKAESEFHRRNGWDVIGMTALTEAKLAREAELCYSLIALVTDYDCWKTGEEVSSSQVVATLNANIANVQRLLEKSLAAAAARPRQCRCGHALAGALVTAPDAMNKKTRARLKLLIGKYL
ncbi:MAG: S-methyl-5'-thioadenosine phosphorylase [Elusimicrobia bacterium]|nr:S-methyl-5'-thioadenosine phosphorylase [Elusimicrobiota bacterium]